MLAVNRISLVLNNYTRKHDCEREVKAIIDYFDQIYKVSYIWSILRWMLMDKLSFLKTYQKYSKNLPL